jgi:putative membrane protein
VGIDIANFTRALVAALVIGLINAVFGEVLGGILGASIIVKLIVNALLFWLAAAVVDGFSLRNGIWSALIGSVLLTFISEAIFWLLGQVGLG